MSPDQIDQLISLVSALLTIVVGALVRHYLPPRHPNDEPDPVSPADDSDPPPADNPKERPRDHPR